MDPTKLIDWLKLPQRLLCGFVIVIALMLWGPEVFVAGLGLEEFIHDYRKYLGVAFLFFLVPASADASHFVWRAGAKKLRDYRWRRRAEARLRDLTPGEKSILSKYIAGNTRTFDLDITDGQTRSLTVAQILYQSSSISSGFTFFAHQMHPWAWEYLHKHPDTLNP